mmetsp:Transcript_43786/g.53040  ORF Transcript_43786/g.53040 Transcript_43786/m.53040 type:complete len:90 (-) Transcript_43786:276-545(-)
MNHFANVPCNGKDSDLTDDDVPLPSIFYDNCYGILHYDDNISSHPILNDNEGYEVLHNNCNMSLSSILISDTKNVPLYAGSMSDIMMMK